MATLAAVVRPAALVGRPAAQLAAPCPALTSRTARHSCQPILKPAFTWTPQIAPVQSVQLGYGMISKALCASAAAALATAAAAPSVQPGFDAALQAAAIEAEQLSKVCFSRQCPVWCFRTRCLLTRLFAVAIALQPGFVNSALLCVAAFSTSKAIVRAAATSSPPPVQWVVVAAAAIVVAVSNVWRNWTWRDVAARLVDSAKRKLAAAEAAQRDLAAAEAEARRARQYAQQLTHELGQLKRDVRHHEQQLGESQKRLEDPEKLGKERRLVVQAELAAVMAQRESRGGPPTVVSVEDSGVF